MELDIIFVLAMIAAVIGSAIFLKNIITARKPKKRLAEFLKYAACIAVFFICAWGYVFTNNLLWYGQNPENAQIQMNINAPEVEETSFLYILEKLDADTVPEDVVAVMGTEYEEYDEGSYMIRYTVPNCTLNGKQPRYISFVFNKKRTALLKIVWSYKYPTPEFFTETLSYLEANAFGKAAASTATTADWAGLHLEDTGEYLLLQRIF